MCDCIDCLLDCKDWIILFLGSVFTAGWTFLLYTLKPNLEIIEPELGNDYLKIKVKNNGEFKAVNLKIEACVVEKGIEKRFTYHLELDTDDFLILPPKKTRGFQSFNKAKSAEKYQKTFDDLLNDFKTQSDTTSIRVRVHANHEYSGFGKALEKTFKWNGNVFEEFTSTRKC